MSPPRLSLCVVALTASLSLVACLRVPQLSQQRPLPTPLAYHPSQTTPADNFRTMASISDFACYGNYCGIQSTCADRPLAPADRRAPVDRFDAACFLHDICYTCSTASTNEACCPDESLRGIDKAECDRVLLARMKNDNLCAGSPFKADSTVEAIQNLVGRDETVAERAGCTATLEGTIQLFEGILQGRQFQNDLTGTGMPSATNNINATCTAFQCPYTGGSDCFLPCGDDGCGATCAGSEMPNTCPSGQQCNAYAHACFVTNNDVSAGQVMRPQTILLAILGVVALAQLVSAFGL